MESWSKIKLPRVLRCSVPAGLPLRWGCTNKMVCEAGAGRNRKLQSVSDLRLWRGCCSLQTGRSFSITHLTLSTWCQWFPSTSPWSLTWLWDLSLNWETWGDWSRLLVYTHSYSQITVQKKVGFVLDLISVQTNWMTNVRKTSYFELHIFRLVKKNKVACFYL